MRLINADKVKAESREHCKTCVLNGTKQCKTCVVNLICDRLDLQPTVELTEEDAIDKLYATGWLQEHDKELTTMPEGDLISRDALKKAIYAEFGNSNLTDAFNDIIDNAPTVEEKSYAMGYQDGAEDGLQGIRTEGKWIYHRAQGEFLPYMECDNCHEEFLLNMLRPAEFRKINRFCSYCGADMRGEKHD